MQTSTMEYEHSVLLYFHSVIHLHPSPKACTWQRVAYLKAYKVLDQGDEWRAIRPVWLDKHTLLSKMELRCWVRSRHREKKVTDDNRTGIVCAGRHVRLFPLLAVRFLIGPPSTIYSWGPIYVQPQSSRKVVGYAIRRNSYCTERALIDRPRSNKIWSLIDLGRPRSSDSH